MKYLNKQQNFKFNIKLINSLSKELNLSVNLVKLLFMRGLTTKEGITDFLNCGINSFYNPFLLSGMTDAANLIKQSIADNKKIIIVGDYDCDGICATAVLYKYFESINIKVDYFLPHRFLDGYGLTIETVDKIYKEFNPDLMITVDCGISCHKEIDYAKTLGMQVIVTDHHEIPETLPNCICVDPKIKSNYPFSELCGAGVALKLVQALAGLTEALKYTNIAALATVADIVPLTHENRAIVKHGLENQATLPVGLKKLISSLKINTITATDIAFKLAPKINTAGRMGDASVAYKLFIEKNPIEINNILTNLETQNNQRIEAGNLIYEDSINKLSTVCVSSLSAITLYDDSWHAGVLGIVCARLAEKYNRTVCLLTKVDGIYKGSIRSANGVNVFAELTKLNNLLIKFGGHHGAAGLSIEEQNVTKFAEMFNNNILNTTSKECFEAVKQFDFDVMQDNIDMAFVKEMQALEPFGFGNEKPVFKYSFNNIKPERFKNYPQYLKFKAPNFEMVSFSHSDYFDSFQTNCKKNALIDLNIDVFNKKERLKAIVKSVSFDKLNTQVKTEIEQGYYVKQLNSLKLGSKAATEITDTQLTEMLSAGVGTLVVASSFYSYEQALNKFKFNNFDSFNLKNFSGENTLLYLLKNTQNLNIFKNIVFIDPVLDLGFLKDVKSDIYTLNLNPKQKLNLNTDHSAFSDVHRALSVMNAKNLNAGSIQEYFSLLTKQNPKYKTIKFSQFVFATIVFSELNFIEIENNLNFYKIKVLKSDKNPLTNSKIYNFVNLSQKVGL